MSQRIKHDNILKILFVRDVKLKMTVILGIELPENLERQMHFFRNIEKKLDEGSWISV